MKQKLQCAPPETIAYLAKNKDNWVYIDRQIDRLDQIRLDWIRLDQIRLDRQIDQNRLDQIRLDRFDRLID